MGLKRYLTVFYMGFRFMGEFMNLNNLLELIKAIGIKYIAAIKGQLFLYLQPLTDFQSTYLLLKLFNVMLLLLFNTCFEVFFINVKF